MPRLAQAMSGLTNNPPDREEGMGMPPGLRPGVQPAATFRDVFSRSVNDEMQQKFADGHCGAVNEKPHFEDVQLEPSPTMKTQRKKRHGCKVAILIAVLLFLIVAGAAIGNHLPHSSC